MNTYNCFIRAHSHHHLEIKSQFLLNANASRSDFGMECYFYIPAQLGVNSKDMGVKRFFKSIKINTRFTSPKLSLSRLVSPECELSPLIRLRNLIAISDRENDQKKSSSRKNHKDPIVHELQILTNIFRSAVTNFVFLLRQQIAKDMTEDLCRQSIDNFLSELATFIEQFRALHPQFITPKITDLQREALRWADEAISVMTERNLNRLFTSCKKMQSLDKLLIEFEKLAQNEADYRKSMNYRYYFDETNEHSGESMAYRDSILKKWSQSALYLNSETSGTPKRIKEIFSGIAAGLAMIFAVLITIIASKYFPPNTTPWALLIVVSYIFKDRIKEALRDSFGGMQSYVASQERIILVDPRTSCKVGFSKGHVRFGKACDAPEKIRLIRNRRPNPFLNILPEENLLQYKHSISLKSQTIRADHQRISGVTEILRFNLEDWLRQMDDERDTFYRLIDGKKLKIKGTRVYHVRLIVNLTQKGSNDDKIIHYKIVLNRAGILRIQEL